MATWLDARLSLKEKLEKGKNQFQTSRPPYTSGGEDGAAPKWKAKPKWKGKNQQEKEEQA